MAPQSNNKCRAARAALRTTIAGSALVQTGESVQIVQREGKSPERDPAKPAQSAAASLLEVGKKSDCSGCCDWMCDKQSAGNTENTQKDQGGLATGEAAAKKTAAEEEAAEEEAAVEAKTAAEQAAAEQNTIKEEVAAEKVQKQLATMKEAAAKEAEQNPPILKRARVAGLGCGSFGKK